MNSKNPSFGWEWENKEEMKHREWWQPQFLFGFFLLFFFAFGMFVFITSIWLFLLLMLLVLLLHRPKWILVVVQMVMMLESRGSLRFCIAWELCLFSSIVRFISVHTFKKMFNVHTHSSHTASFGWIWCELSEKGQFSISTF